MNEDEKQQSGPVIRVLLVEDSDSDVELATLAFEKLDRRVSVEMAADGVHCLAWLQARIDARQRRDRHEREQYDRRETAAERKRHPADGPPMAITAPGRRGPTPGETNRDRQAPKIHAGG